MCLAFLHSHKLHFASQVGEMSSRSPVRIPVELLDIFQVSLHSVACGSVKIGKTSGLKILEVRITCYNVLEILCH